MFNRGNENPDGRQQPGGAAARVPGRIAHIIVSSALINVVGLAVPLTLLQVFDRIIPAREEGALFWPAIGITAALVLEALLRMGRAYLGAWMGARYEHVAGVRALERLIKAPIVEFQKAGTGHYLERLNALGRLGALYTGRSAGALIDLPFAAIYLGAIAYLSWPLALVPLALVVLFAGAAQGFARLRQALRERMLADDRRFGFIVEVLGGIHTVKGLGMEEQMLRRYERLQETCAETEHDLTTSGSLTAGLGTLFTQLVIVVVAGLGAVFVIDGALTVGSLLASIVLAARVAGPLEDVAAQWATFQDARIASGRLDEIFAMPTDKPTAEVELPQIDGAVAFDDVTFDYGVGKDGEPLPPVFDRLSFRIEPGETIGVVGGSGSGKTTLLFLMMGMLTPTEGTVRIDGYDLRECDPINVRHQVAYLPQEGIVFKGTLTENLTMFREERTDDALGIARVLGLDGVAQALPQGFDTVLGEGALDQLPRGTRQRIAIARALVDRPRTLLFDEANSFIDGAGDAMLLQMLARLKGRVTQVMVTQRPSMLRLSDRVFQIQGTGIVDHSLQKKAAEAKARAQAEARTRPGAPRAAHPAPSAPPPEAR